MRRKQNLDACDGLQQGLFMPKSTWTPPRSFPDLSREKIIGIDIESKDPYLKERGPGFIRGDAEVVGISVSTITNAWYFPIRHLSGGNMDRSAVISFIQQIVNRQDLFICGANLQYELEGLDSQGIEVRSKVIDVQLAEALIDEESPTGYALENLCMKYLGRSKDETLLRDAIAAHGLKEAKGSLWKLHSRFVGPYAEADAMDPLHIFAKQKEILKRENLESIFQLESELLPILWLMRKRGIPMDMDAAKSLSAKLYDEEQIMRKHLRDKWGVDFDPYEAGKIAMTAQRHGIGFPKTPRGNPSFTGDFLESAKHPFYDDISDFRELVDMRSKFVDGWILKNAINGRVHPRWKQMASDDGGTRTGRMAASDPNPQQIPAGKYRKTGKPNEIGKAIRACFISTTGKWGKYDYDQQEPRVLVHYAAIMECTMAKETRQKFIDAGYKSKNDGGYDLYRPISEISGLDMRPTKDAYLGRCYGMGIRKMSYKFNKTEAESRDILAKFDAAAPYIREIAELCSASAERRGYIKTILGRRRHFCQFEPARKPESESEPGAMLADGRLRWIPLTQKFAETTWPGEHLRRANCHKALNSLIQGSSADVTKASMVANYEATGDYPYMQVHDELNYPLEGDEHACALREVIQHSVDMTVPIVTKMEIGEHWK
jgi:DNA polymerase I-like protein with 3'-5' exonuclease and polymerase domains